MKFCLVFALLLPFFYCQKGMDVTEIDANKDGKTDQYLYEVEKAGYVMKVDSDLDGSLDDTTWLKINPEKKEELMLFFNEINLKENQTRIWFGPRNLKIIETKDMDNDGKYETTFYFNREGKPKVLDGIIARIEVDFDHDQLPDIWLYPGKRIEFTLKKTGKPDQFTADAKLVTENSNLMTAKKFSELKGQPLGQGQSWALHPELITEKRFQAIIEKSL